MTRNAAVSGAAQAFVEARRARIASLLGRALEPACLGCERLPPERLAYFRHEAEELYWNELGWEEITDEEAITGGHMTEMVFPAFLAFVQGLMNNREDGPVPPRPHPDAVEEILLFLGERHAACTAELERGVDSQKVVWARMMTAHLVDLSLYRLYRLPASEQEYLEGRR
jgi:hypothetical protein